MAIDFPSTPIEGQKFTQGTVVYTFTGGVWSAAPLGTALPFNYVVNGSMQVSQQLGRASQTGNVYIADQWMAVSHSTTHTTASETPSYPYYARLWSGGVFTPAAHNHAYFTQTIEGNRMAAFQWGTATAKPVVLRFKARITGAPLPFVFGVSVRTATTSPYYSFAHNFTLTTAGVFQEFTLPVTPPTTGGDTIWPKNANGGLTLFFTAMESGNYSTPTPDMWVTGNFIAATGVSNLYAVTGRGFDIAEVGLYLDPNATGRAPPLEAVDERQAFMDSLRYWCKNQGLRGVSNGSMARACNQYIVPMRAGPAYAIVGACAVWDQATSSAITSLSPAFPNIHYCEADCATAAATMLGRACFMPGDDKIGAVYIANSARM